MTWRQLDFLVGFPMPLFIVVSRAQGLVHEFHSALRALESASVRDVDAAIL